jgi:ribosomal protein L12E/L44/L45/RPP1/RPP2
MMMMMMMMMMMILMFLSEIDLKNWKKSPQKKAPAAVSTTRPVAAALFGLVQARGPARRRRDVDVEEEEEEEEEDDDEEEEDSFINDDSYGGSETGRISCMCLPCHDLV